MIRKQRVSTKFTTLLILSLFLISFFSPFVVTSKVHEASIGSNHGDTPFLSTDSSQLRQKISSEEENIDSFDVNPKSGRWNVTETGQTDDQITEGNLRLITTENTTSSSNQYHSERDLRDIDGRIDYRYKTIADNQSQVEYSRDVWGDSWDFDEGDLEGWSGLATDSVSNGLYIGLMAAATDDRLSLTISASTTVYQTLKFRIKANVEDLIGHFRPITVEGGQQRYSDNFVLTTEWQEITVVGNSNWDLDRTFTSLVLLFDEDGGDGTLEATDEVSIDWIKLIGNLDYATHEEGTIEDTWNWGEADTEGFSGNSHDIFQQSNGFLQMSPATDASPYVFATITLTVDTSIFDTVKIRANVSSAESRDINLLLEGCGSKFQDLTSSLTELTFDISDCSSLSANYMRIYMDNDDPGTGNVLDADNFYIDYILLEASEEQEQEFTMGFWDKENNNALVNITHHMFNGSRFRWEIEMYDSNQEIASYYYSDNYSVTDEFYRVAISYHALESEFSLTMNADNLSRIFRARFGVEFTTSNDNPSFFAIDRNPTLYFNNWVQFYGSLETWIDYINAQYKERQWIQTDEGDSSFTTDTWKSSVIDGRSSQAGDTSTWELTVPRLDAFSGDLAINLNSTELDSLDIVQTTLTLYHIDPVTGDKEGVAVLSIIAGDCSDAACVSANIDDPPYLIGGIVGGDQLYLNETGTQQTNPVIEFNFNTENNRDRINLQARFFPDATNASKAFLLSSSASITDLYGDVSQEFIIQITYAATNFDSFATLSLSNFELLQRDAVAGWLAQEFLGLDDVNSEIAQIIQEDQPFDAFSFLANTIVGGLRSAFQTIIDGLQTALESAFGVLGVLIDAAIDALELVVTALGPVFEGIIDSAFAVIEPFLDGVEGFLSDIADFIVALAADIWTALDPVISDLLDTLATLFGGFFEDLVDVVIPFFADVWDALVTGIANILDPSGDLKTAIDNLVTSVSDFFDNIFAVFNLLGDLLPWLVIGLLFFMFTLPFIMNRDERTGRIHFGKSFSGVVHNSFVSVRTPEFSALGFMAVITIPLIIIIYIALKVLIGEGVFPDIFGGLPI